MTYREWLDWRVKNYGVHPDDQPSLDELAFEAGKMIERARCWRLASGWRCDTVAEQIEDDEIPTHFSPLMFLEKP